MQSIRLAFRTLMRTPFVTAVAVISLALGIGANTAIFSLFNQLLLKKLPVREPGALVSLSAPGPKPGSQSCNQAGDCDVVLSYPMYRDLEKGQTVFTGLAAHRAFGANIAARKQTLNGSGMYVSGSYFPVLGVQPAMGRLLGPADDEAIGTGFVAVLSHRYWDTKLGKDPTVLNEPLVVNGVTFTIVGVAPEGFNGTTLGSLPDVFVPISMRGQVEKRFNGFERRREYWLYAFGRLKPGTTIEQATSAMNLLYAPILSDVEAPLQEGMSDTTLVRFKAKKLLLEMAPQGQSSLHADARTPLGVLFGVTGVVLLIACANIANLLLARGAGRATEMAVRMSLGAQRRQVIAQLLLEACLLALLAGAASLVVARWTLSGIAAALPRQAADLLTLSLDWQVVAFAAALSLGTGLLFGLFPALHSTRPDLIQGIRAATGQASEARSASRFRSSLVTVQISLAMALLTCAGLFIKSLRNVARVDVGAANVDQLVTFRVSPELNGYTGGRSHVFFSRLTEELAAIPGVSAVSTAMVPFLGGSNWGNDVSVEGWRGGPDIDSNARFNMVGPRYLATLGMPLVAGREFTEADLAGGPKVVMVNEAFAKKFNLGTQAVGRRMSMNSSSNAELDLEIVGLMRDAKYAGVKDEVPPLFFIPSRQDTTLGEQSFYVRTSASASELLRAIPGVVARLDPNLPVEELKTMPQQVKDNVFMDRMISTLSSAFALLATLLAAVGLYGVLAYTVAQRTREIGVRMALGANAGRVRGMVMRQVGVLTAIGAVAGMAGALALGRAASSLLYGLRPHDPVVFAGSAVVLTLVALGAGYLPALRASRVHPMRALRYE